MASKYERINREDKVYTEEVIAEIQRLIDGKADVRVRFLEKGAERIEGGPEAGWKVSRIAYDDEYHLKVVVANRDGTHMLKVNPDEFLEWQKDF